MSLWPGERGTQEEEYDREWDPVLFAFQMIQCPALLLRNIRLPEKKKILLRRYWCKMYSAEVVPGIKNLIGLLYVIKL